MKRSRAVLIIAESLVEPHHPDDAMKEASSILRRLELAGIVSPPPPPTVEGYLASLDNDCGWEPESEL